MPLNEARRRDSWPPTILRLNDEDLGDIAEIEDIDLNPFSYFLTSPEEFDEELEDLSAGIESDEEIAPSVREVSPSSLQRIPEDVEDDSYLTQDVGRGFAQPVTLQSFTEIHLSEQYKKTTNRGTDEFDGPNYGHIPPTPTLRGRGTIRLGVPGGRGRGQTRSLPGVRPHSWQEPSPDVWSIPEENEEQDDSADIMSPLSLNDAEESKMPQVHEEKAPSQHGLEENPTTSPLKKLKKKVRFALP